MDTALPQKLPFILDRNLAKANYTENHVCTSCDTVVLGLIPLLYTNQSIYVYLPGDDTCATYCKWNDQLFIIFNPCHFHSFPIIWVTFLFYFFEGTLFSRKLHLKNFNIKNKDNKISQGRGNSLGYIWFRAVNYYYIVSGALYVI